MTYIILRDTFGDGLELIPNIGVDVIEEDQLDEYIYEAVEDNLDCFEDSKKLSIEGVVICEILKVYYETHGNYQ